MGFKVGQKVVYPNHGIGTIERIEQKQIGAALLPFYTLRLAANNSLVLVPVSNASEVGLRSPISSGECEMLLKALADDFASPAHDWKDRFKDFSEKMRTGDIFEVAEVVRNLAIRHADKGLSTGEKQMFSKAKKILASELMYAREFSEDEANAFLETVLEDIHVDGPALADDSREPAPVV